MLIYELFKSYTICLIFKHKFRRFLYKTSAGVKTNNVKQNLRCTILVIRETRVRVVNDGGADGGGVHDTNGTTNG